MKNTPLLALLALAAAAALGGCTSNGDGSFISPNPNPTVSGGIPVNPLPTMTPLPTSAPSSTPSSSPSTSPTSTP